MQLKRSIEIAAVLSIITAVLLLPVVIHAQDEMPRQGFFDVRSASTSLQNGVHELEAQMSRLEWTQKAETPV